MLVLALRRIKEEGLVNLIKIHLKRILGITKGEEEINTLFFLLNNYVDITKLPSIQDEEFLKLQKCLYALLLIFHRLCEKYKYEYWIAYGTMLGAVRHRGFIPWDDDVDVSMPRKYYEKLSGDFKMELESYGLEFENEQFHTAAHISYKRKQTGIFMDVFPIYEMFVNGKVDEIKPKVIKVLQKHRTYYRNLRDQSKIEEIDAHREEISKKMEKGNNVIYVHSPEENGYWSIYDKEDIYPLNKIVFEEGLFWSPANPEVYLRRRYGKNYMQFPRTGVEHHVTKDGVLAKKLAKENNVDMDEVYNYLINVANRISRE